MADSSTKRKRRAASKDPPAFGPNLHVAEGAYDELVVTSPPVLKSADQQQQRKKLKVLLELEDFRASFSRGYAVILAELARKHKQPRNK